MHLQTVGYNATAAATTGTAAAAMTGDSLMVAAGREGSRIRIVDWWGKSNATMGWHQLVHPSGHDVSRGIRSVIQLNQTARFNPVGAPEDVQPGETLSLTIAAGAVAGDIELGFMSILYDDLPGIAGRLLGWNEVESRIEKMVSVQASITLAATGSWAGAELITAESDLLLANRDYAWVGGSAVLPIGAIAMQAPDFGNVRIACPADTRDADMGCEHFLWLSYETGLPCIPVFNSGNKGNVWLSACDDENGAATVCSWNLALLKG